MGSYTRSEQFVQCSPVFDQKVMTNAIMCPFENKQHKGITMTFNNFIVIFNLPNTGIDE